MNSPEPISPSLSSTSSTSPPPDEIFFLEPTQFPADGSSPSLLAGSSQAAQASSSFKRRTFSGKTNRDSKAARREGSGKVMVGGSGSWDKEGPGRKEDMIDNAWVDFLRKEIGDPFSAI